MPQFSSSLEHMEAVAAGLVPGSSLTHKVGRNTSVANGAWEMINSNGTNNWQLSTAAVFRVAAGGNAADTAAGAGAREVTFVGIDETGAVVTEAVATAGASASATTVTTFIRVYHAHVSSVGTRYASNTGIITIETGGSTTMIIAADEGNAEFGGHTVPLGTDCYLMGVKGDVEANKPASIRMFVVEDILNTTAPFSPKTQELFYNNIDGSYDEERKSPLVVMPELSDIWFEAYGGGAATEVDVSFELLFIDRNL